MKQLTFLLLMALGGAVCNTAPAATHYLPAAELSSSPAQTQPAKQKRHLHKHRHKHFKHTRRHKRK